MYNPILNHKGLKSIKIVQLSQKLKKRKSFFLKEKLKHNFPSPTPTSHSIHIMGKGSIKQMKQIEKDEK